MKLYYFRSRPANFGDDLNLWLWPKLLPQPFEGVCYHAEVEARDGNEEETTLFLGIGTLLNSRVPVSPLKLVFGTGTGYGSPPVIDRNWQFLCVRGPLTAAALGLPQSLAITDPALLLRTVELPPPAEPVRFSFIPHIRCGDFAAWETICHELQIRFIHPSVSVPSVVAQIRSSDVVICEAMHGAIVADALRVPWIPVRCYPHINDFKWRDWCASLGLTYEPAVLPPLWPPPPDGGKTVLLAKKAKAALARAKLRWLVARARPRLSPDRTMERATSRLQETLDRLRLRVSEERISSLDDAVGRQQSS